MGFAGFEDRDAIEAEMAWAERRLPVTLYQAMSETAAKHPDRNAVSYQIFSGPNDKAETLTWSVLKDQVTQTANLFRALGVGETDVVAYILPNANETVLALLGGAVAGIANPINPLLDAEQIGSILRETKAKVVVTLRPFPKTDVADKAAQAVALAPNVQTVLEVDLLRYLTPPKSWIVPLIRPKRAVQNQAQYLNFSAEIAKQPKTLSFADSTEDRVACYFHTGGTTGMPKVAQHLYSGLIYNGWVGTKLLFTEQDNIMCPLPLFHVFACHVILMAAVVSGAHVVFPTPQGYRGEGVMDNFWKLVERWKISFIITVPTAISAKMQRPIDADVSSVKIAFSGSAPLPLELFRRFEEATGVKLVEGYGLTEATCLVSCNPVDGEKKVGSIGIPFPYCSVKILKTTEEGHVEAGVDEVGEICVSNPGVFVGSTYTEAEKNNDLFHGDHLRTGDLGRVDGDGYLWITGRAKDLIIRGGHNIDPAEIEEALLHHEAVAFAGAIGQPDAHAGEVPCAFVELVEGAEVSEGELLEFCKSHVLERAAQPKHMTILPELPKTAVGKIFKPDLRKHAVMRIYNGALEEAGVSARVVTVVDDKKRGLVAQVAAHGAGEDEVAAVLGQFIRPWEFSTTA
ncbi:acyl-CoA synthetase [Roseobacter denitrificans]|uniref:Long-chain-fatty-acid--CoA ligase, putative n=1 Tax=Roseobacter denitrificans (strain ATCC 33942 / OCh 114) TaxID=375451 RepID=Q168L3_ROSDO|nr:acyl-CoA synthetase [Roseobacter denitrificans]ABG31580.1 long-chain-fatty-acid--CoA ligase, putative [Roseobacter denitrificans OCh 114]AVL54571.1 acyl-CoA synthetase [Roseobacter denitrificans]SFF89673.1 fatty-acyl-CoA synthase/long-chain acyl-CoA synthetase [Roseobacter denitrificans OCh 114]